MDTNPLFTIALGLGSPWEVQRTEFDPAKRVLRLRVDFKPQSPGSPGLFVETL
jgi:hypothetical protein